MIMPEELASLLTPKQTKRDYECSLDDDVQVQRLKEALKDYQSQLAGCKFLAGDIVTPKPAFGIKGTGAPHIVLETRKHPEPLFDPQNAASCQNGNRQDMRIIVMVSNDVMFSYWVESFQYEIWQG